MWVSLDRGPRIPARAAASFLEKIESEAKRCYNGVNGRKRVKKGGTSMDNYIISCCSPVDLREQHLRERDIRYICFHFMVDGKTHEDDLWQSMTCQELYRRMEAGAVLFTQQGQ